MKKLTAAAIIAAIVLLMAIQYSEAERQVDQVGSLYGQAAQIEEAARSAAYKQ